MLRVGNCKCFKGGGRHLNNESTWLVEISFQEHQPISGGINPHIIEIFTLMYSSGFSAYGWAPELTRISEQDLLNLDNMSSKYTFRMFLFSKNEVLLT